MYYLISETYEVVTEVETDNTLPVETTDYPVVPVTTPVRKFYYFFYF